MHLLVFPFQTQNDKGLLRFTKVCGSPFTSLTPPKNCIGLNGVDLAASVFFNLHKSLVVELFVLYKLRAHNRTVFKSYH